MCMFVCLGVSGEEEEKKEGMEETMHRRKEKRVLADELIAGTFVDQFTKGGEA